jgi:hypothetical protein
VALLDEHLKDELQRSHQIVRIDGSSYAAIWKRMLGSEKKRPAKITNSRNAIPKICKRMYKSE